MKQLAVVTYIGDNYGSMLQAYALKQMLLSRNYKSDIVQIKNAGGIKRRINHILSALIDPVRYLKKKHNTSSHAVRIADLYERCEKFRNDVLEIKRVTYEEIKKATKSEEYLCAIAGSDQVWNGRNGFDKSRFLSFIEKSRRIAYAPSLGGVILKENERFFRNWIKQVPYLSVRELLGADEIKRVCNRDAAVVLDPSLLVTNDFWKERAIAPKVNERYILCYFLSEPSDIAIGHIRYLKEKYSCKVISILKNVAIDQEIVEESYTPEVFEFLGFFANAEFVFTDSFHGCAFSISFEKPFFVYHRQYKSNYTGISRINSILKIIERSDRLIVDQSYANIEVEMEYNSINCILADKRAESMNFLINALESINTL